MKNSGARAGKVLLIGDINRVFLDAEAVSELPCETRLNMADGVNAAAKGNFTAVAVVIAGSPEESSRTSAELSSALKTLRKVSPESKIVLLAQMYEEPLAMRLMGSVSEAVRIADDYLICPIAASRFCGEVVRKDSIGVSGQRLPAETVPPAAGVQTLGPRTEDKIKQLEKLATEDYLTGLKNRRYIMEFSRQIIERAVRENGCVTLLLFDIDNLKSYNDTYGHQAGDEVLRQTADLVRRCCRSHDVVGRVGGDEFAVVFWDGPETSPAGDKAERRSAVAEHPKEVIFIAKRFQRELEKTKFPLLGPKGKGVLTISGGLASFQRDGSTVDELFEQADRALLDAKRSGKNKIYLVGRAESDIADIE